jgi:vacuolar-type H+-ATPase subunit I/STV1
MFEDLARSLSGAIERSDVSLALQGLHDEVVVTQSIHLLGIALLMGSAAMIVLRLLGCANTDVPAGMIVARYLRSFRWGLGVAALSGLAMLATEPSRSLPSVPFQIKLLMLLALVVILRVIGKTVPRAAGAASSPLARLAAIALIAVLLVIIWCGRWIPYYA